MPITDKFQLFVKLSNLNVCNFIVDVDDDDDDDECKIAILRVLSKNCCFNI